MVKWHRTVSRAVTLDGIGLHTGVISTIIIKPAKETAGISFIRTDLDAKPTIPAIIENVVDTNRGTTLAKNGAHIHTVEHVLAALSGLGIDNAVIEINSLEPPAMDGSALPFVEAIHKAGIDEQKTERNYVKIEEPLRYFDKTNHIEINILPAEHFKITFFMNYNLKDFDMQYTSVIITELEFKTAIAPARTFGLLSEIIELKKDGLIKGGNLENAVVVVDENISEYKEHRLRKLFNIKKAITFNNGAILNPGGLRFKNEPVRHKVLDLVGDFALLGRPIKGHVIATRSGHSANIETVKMIKRVMKL